MDGVSQWKTTAMSSDHVKPNRLGENLVVHLWFTGGHWYKLNLGLTTQCYNRMLILYADQGAAPRYRFMETRYEAYPDIIFLPLQVLNAQ